MRWGNFVGWTGGHACQTEIDDCRKQIYESMLDASSDTPWLLRPTCMLYESTTDNPARQKSGCLQKPNVSIVLTIFATTDPHWPHVADVLLCNILCFLTTRPLFLSLQQR